MRKLISLWLVLSLVLLAGSWAFAQMHNDGNIRGRVTDQITSQPIPMAVVEAFAVNNPAGPVGRAMTGYDGSYRLRVPYGQYHVVASKFGYQPEWYLEAPDRSLATVVTVASGQDADSIDFTLSPPAPPRTGSISGQVTDQNTNAPIPFAMVRAFSANNIMFSGHADSVGHYELVVPYGTYKVAAEKWGYAVEWWQEVPDRSLATPVTVDSSQSPDHINFTLSPLTPPQGGSIAGMVTDAVTSAPIAGAAIHARSRNNTGSHRVAFSGDDGTYLLGDLRPGVYYLDCYKDGYVPAHYPDSIVINGNNVTGIDFALQPIVMGSISGLVMNAADSMPIAGACVTAIATNNARGCFRAVTDSTGAYLLELPVGTYRMECRARDFYPVVVDTPVVVGDLTPITDYNFVLTPINFGSIAGTVYDTANTPLFGIFVEARRIGGYGRAFARTDSSGNYVINNVIPGDYIVCAYGRGYQPAVYPETVVVGDGQAVTGIDFHLLPFSAPNGTIGGQVFDDSTGQPIEGALVVALGTMRQGHMSRFNVRYTRTAADGSYLLERLASQPYKVLCLARGYLPEFYNNKRTWQEADPVTPNATGIDFGLAHGNFGPRFLAGRVLEGYSPTPGALVMAYDGDQLVDVAATMPDGSYWFENLVPGQYRLEGTDLNNCSGTQIVELTFGDIYSADINVVTTDIDGEVNLPVATTLLQNYPNPFNSSTNIGFVLAEASNVDLSVYDLLGRRVTTLISGWLPAGDRMVVWDGLDDHGRPVASGLYLYILKTDAGMQSRRMLLVK